MQFSTYIYINILVIGVWTAFILGGLHYLNSAELIDTTNIEKLFSFFFKGAISVMAVASTMIFVNEFSFEFVHDKFGEFLWWYFALPAACIGVSFASVAIVQKFGRYCAYIGILVYHWYVAGIDAAKVRRNSLPDIKLSR